MYSSSFQVHFARFNFIFVLFFLLEGIINPRQRLSFTVFFLFLNATVSDFCCDESCDSKALITSQSLLVIRSYTARNGI